MGDQADGYEVIPSDLRSAMAACAGQVPMIDTCLRLFEPAKLTRHDFSVAPGADDLGRAYVDGTPEKKHEDKRYESVHGYLTDLRDALSEISHRLEATAHTYTKAHEASLPGPGK